MDKKDVDWVVKNWDKIPDEFKTNIKQGENLPNIKEEGHILVLLLDRQKPSVERCYDFDEERFGVNRFGQIIWGFDSGCSCPAPWDDSYPRCYSSGSWKTFEVNRKKFDVGFEEEVKRKIAEIKRAIKKQKSN